MVIAAGLVIGCRRPIAARAARGGPRVGIIALVAGAAFELASSALPTWPGVAVLVAVQAALMMLVAYWSRSNRWAPRHTVSLTGSALLIYAWHAFPGHPAVPVSPTTDLVGNAVFAAAALALLAAALRRSTAPRVRIA